jgi:multidrug efflux pump subunit AcrA (membrane-fusion protein)
MSDERATSAGPRRPDAARQFEDAHSPAMRDLANMPRPAARGLVYLLLAIVVGIGAWSYVGKKDIIVEARGQLAPRGGARIVQAPRAGTIVEVLVREGDHVVAGQPLVLLDTTQTGITQAQRERELASLEERQACRERALGLMRRALGDYDTGRTVSAAVRGGMSELCADQDASPIRDLVRAIEDFRKAETEHRELAPKATGSLRGSIASKQSSLETLRESAARAEDESGQLRAELDDLKSLGAQGLVSRARLSDAQRTLNESLDRHAQLLSDMVQLEAQISADRAQLDAHLRRTESALLGAEQAMRQAEIDFRQDIAEMGVAIDETRMETARMRDELRLATFEVGRASVNAAVEGTVGEMTSARPLAFVDAGTPLMSIIPGDQPLVARVHIRNRDMANVRPGLGVKVKLHAFPYEKYGIARGELVSISADSRIREGQEPYFEAIASVEPARTDQGARYELSPGLTLDMEVVTGQERIIDMVLRPFRRLKADLES